jgi:hypothetical protein
MVKIEHPSRGTKRKHDSIQASDQGAPDASSRDDRDNPTKLSGDRGDNIQQASERSGSVIEKEEPQASRSLQPQNCQSASSSTHVVIDFAQSSGNTTRRRSSWTRTSRIRNKVFRMVDIMIVIYGMLEPSDKKSLMKCSSTFLRLGVQAGGLREDQHEKWLAKWARPRVGLEVSP